jgi:hypothetical protein
LAGVEPDGTIENSGSGERVWGILDGPHETDGPPPRPRERAGRRARVAGSCNTGGVTTDDPLAPLREQVAAEHLGDAKVGDRLRGSDEEELRADAEQLREQAGLTGSGRPGLGGAVFVWHEQERRLNERMFGKGAP